MAKPTAAARDPHVRCAFSAPELIAHPNVADSDSDIFGAGAVLFYMLCGRPPFSEELPGPQVTSAFDRELPDPRELNPGISAAIARVIVQAMSEHSRFLSAVEMRQALREATAM